MGHYSAKDLLSSLFSKTEHVESIFTNMVQSKRKREGGRERNIEPERTNK